MTVFVFAGINNLNKTGGRRMHRIYIIALIWLTIIACGCTQISVKKDEISNRSILNMKIIIAPDDYTFMGTSRIEFTRELVKNNYSPIQLKLELHSVKRFQLFDDVINLKIDNTVYKLKMKSITSDILSGLAGAKNLSNLGIGFNDTRGVGLSPTVKLTQEVEKALSNAKSIMFTITNGSEFVLFKFTNNDIKSIKKFISYKID
jgi:hypothetical protein